jgi:large subunit ribosomal protein L21e
VVKAPKGYRHRTRKILRKRVRERGGVPSLSYLLIDYRDGDRVHIVIDPAIQKSMPHRRYHGRTGIIVGKRGKSYEVKVHLGDKEKTLYVRPEHLRPAPEVWERVVSETRSLIESIKSRIREANSVILKALSTA